MDKSNLDSKERTPKTPILPLVGKTYDFLNWDHFSIPNQRMIRIFTIPDGHCMFHAIANAFFIPYRKGTINNIPITQTEIVTRMRSDLAHQLELKSIENPSKTNYEMLGGGAVATMSETLPRYKLSNMIKELMSSSPIDNLYNEFISNTLNKDIYILSAEKEDVYMFGDDYKLLYKNRESIVILYVPGHYELVGLQDKNGRERTIFPYNDPFINLIRKRMDMLCSGSFLSVPVNN